MQEKELLEEETILQAKPITVDTPSYPEDELFQNYEINRFRLTPYFYKIVGASVLLNSVFVLAATQFDLYQSKACDSFYVSKVCSVIDAVYVGSQFFGTKSSTVSEPYDKTEFDTEDIVWIDKTDTSLFKYPEGYFYKEEEQLPPANEFGMVNGGDAKSTNPGAFLAPGQNPFTTTPTNPTTTTPNTTNPIASNPTTPGSSLDLSRKADLPKRGKVKDDLPTSVIGGNPIAKGKSDLEIIKRTPKKDILSDNPGKLPDDPTTAGIDPKNVQPTPPNKVESKKTEAIVINKQPVKDFGRFVLGEIKTKQVNLEAPFSLTASGKLNQEGKLDVKTTKFIEASGDKELINIVQQAVAAVNDSGYLKYLDKLSGKNLTLKVTSDDANITATVQSDLENDGGAKRVANALNLVMEIAKKGKTDPDDKDDLTLLQNAKVQSQGKTLVLQFTVPKAIAREMWTRKLNELAQEKQTNSLEPKQTGLNVAK